jgi:serine/threonine protein kinase
MAAEDSSPTQPAIADGAARAGESLQIGDKVGRYELRALLGAGGMGRVYEAWDSELERAVALKVLHPELGGAASVTDRLVRESRIMARAAHESVITVYGIGRDRDVVFIAMELVRGPTLAAYLSREHPGWRDVVVLLEQAGAGLAAAHAAGIIHRDFKPENVLVGPARKVVVTDFGVARATAGDEPATGTTAPAHARLTATGQAIGTPAYMAPEQLDGHAADERADVFAFCVSAWEAVFGAHPFATANATIDAIRAAHRKPPAPPRTGAPRRLARALQRGLAIDPAARWPGMPPLLVELAAIRRHRTRLAIAATATGLIGLGIAGALVVGHTARADGCANRLAALDRAYRRDLLAARLAHDPATRDRVLATLDGTVKAWHDLHAQTCANDKTPTTTACLDARRSELAGTVDDILADGPGHAVRLLDVVGDPTACATAAAGLVAANVPDTPMLRRKVTALRYRIIDAEALRDRLDDKDALAAELTIVSDAATVWPIVHAEALFLYGATQTHAGDATHALKTLEQAAGVAATAHDDRIAAKAWTALAAATTFDKGDPARGLEYVGYAEAALARIGNPPSLVSPLLYIKGTTLTQANRTDEAETTLRRAVELAKQSDPDGVPSSISGLGFVYQQQGRYAEAADAYRQALAALPSSGPDVASGQVVYREHLGAILFNLGQASEGERITREAVSIADRSLDENSSERYTAHLDLAELLSGTGKLDEALAEAKLGAEGIARTVGMRTATYGEALRIEVDALMSLERNREAEPLSARACDIIAFQATEDSTQYAVCELEHVQLLGELDRPREAVLICDKVLPVLLAKDGADNPEFANGALHCGEIDADVGNDERARTRYEQALAAYLHGPIQPGYIGQVRCKLGELLWRHQPDRARELVEQAAKDLDAAPAGWAELAKSAHAWLAEHPRRATTPRSPR